LRVVAGRDGLIEARIASERGEIVIR
jgi:hypothetical protein